MNTTPMDATTSFTEFDTKAAFNLAFDEKISEEKERNGNDPSTWKASGRASKAYPAKESDAYWRDNGHSHVDNWIKWRKANPNHTVWMAPDGVVGIEMDLTVWFRNVKVKLIIDRVMDLGNGNLGIVDLKSGSKKPSSYLQLGLYACAVEIEYGIRPRLGTYYMTRQGEVTGWESLDHFTIPFMTHLFATMDERVKGRNYLPMPGDHCGYCDGRKYCALMNGVGARTHDVLTKLK